MFFLLCVNFSPFSRSHIRIRQAIRVMLGRSRKPYQQWRILRGFRLHFPVIAVLLVCILIFAFFSACEHRNSVGSELISSQLLNPTVEIVNGTELIWQIPDSPRAVLFLAHGCGGKAVLAISSISKCWTIGMERVVIRDTIQWWIEKNGLLSVPLLAMGASSGGYFVSKLANDDQLRFSSIVIMIAEGLFDQMNIKSNYPPTLFLHMPKDHRRNRVIPIYVELLREKGVDAREAKSMEFPLKPSFLANRVPGLTLMVSESLFELFLEKGFIDDKGYMKKDGRQTPWIKALKESRISFPYETISTHHIQEELNLAFAYHEMTSLQSKEMFKWFESHMR